tara:strand:- start:798 stop:932 length:135 start_codon:yes stop_codon:yes gene_type:complete
MGRKKKYLTKEEKLKARNENQKRYYEKNKEKLKKTRMEKYYETE